MTQACDGKPMLEIACFSSLALIPHCLARFRIVEDGLAAVLEQLHYLLLKIRGKYSVAAHVVSCMKEPLAQMTHWFMQFLALNLFINAVPESFEMDVPKILRFLDADGDGTLTAEEIESFFYCTTGKLFSAFLVTNVIRFLNAAKKPPQGWTLKESLKIQEEVGSISLMEWYWQVTARRAGWWTLLDRVITGLLYIAIVYTWLVAFGINARTVAAAGGAGGLALGLAAQQVVGNGVAALIILATAPCAVGDFVEAGTGDLRYKGVVKEIGWNATALLKDDGDIIYVPNGVVLDSPLVVVDPANVEKAKDDEAYGTMEREDGEETSGPSDAAKRAASEQG